eukprot:m.34061 g.34061  ORF g.34061 m.34061 type:complete len:254 (+) comp11096_c0_seq1:169-930(+)
MAGLEGECPPAAIRLSSPFLPAPPSQGKDCRTVTATGDLLYYYYGCDDTDDRGFGCGYRTISSICSWLRLRRSSIHQLTAAAVVEAPALPVVPDMKREPSIKELQALLGVSGTHWLSTLDAVVPLDTYYQTDCKYASFASGADLQTHASLATLETHFRMHGSPVMVGGNVDASARALLGVHVDPHNLANCRVLVLDPHMYLGLHGGRLTADEIYDAAVSHGYLAWRPLSLFDSRSFYNLAMPQLPRQQQQHMK